jgi:hypothetical protein
MRVWLSLFAALLALAAAATAWIVVIEVIRRTV